MIYIDASCLLKLFRIEPASPAVQTALAVEDLVIVSTLTELEATVQLKAAWKSGELTRPQWRRLEAELALLRNQPPYQFRSLSAALFQTALRQHRNSREVHCRTLDRLHLAAMEELEIKRLMTHDDRQARAAREAGFEVFQPGRSQN